MALNKISTLVGCFHDHSKIDKRKKLRKEIEQSIRTGDGQTAKLLLSWISLNMVNDPINEDGFTALHFATHYGRVDLVRLLLKHGADTECRTTKWIRGIFWFSLKDDRLTALHVACGADRPVKVDPDIVQLLLDNGALVNSKNNEGDTPLICAALCGHEKVLELLLEKGANVNERNNYGETALQETCGWSEKIKPEIVRLLLANGASVDCRNKYGWTPLMRAVKRGYKDVAELLMEAGANVNARDDVYSSSHSTSTNQYYWIVKFHTALDMARLGSESWLNQEPRKKFKEMIQFLQSAQANPRSLKSCCKIGIWKHCITIMQLNGQTSYQLRQGLNELHLPTQLKSYLLYQD